MPLYEYECQAGHRFETIQRFSDPPLDRCPTCGAEVRKLQSAPAFHLKGSGWYITDYARKDQGAKDEGAKDGGTKDGGTKDGGMKDGGTKDEGAKGSEASKSGESGSGSAAPQGEKKSEGKSESKPEKGSEKTTSSDVKPG
jgi:putative FmdB family regulatory protein